MVRSVGQLEVLRIRALDILDETPPEILAKVRAHAQQRSIWQQRQLEAKLRALAPVGLRPADLPPPITWPLAPRPPPERPPPERPAASRQRSSNSRSASPPQGRPPPPPPCPHARSAHPARAAPVALDSSLDQGGSSPRDRSPPQRQDSAPPGLRAAAARAAQTVPSKSRPPVPFRDSGVSAVRTSDQPLPMG